MSAVPDVIFLGRLTGQANLDGLEALRFSSRTAVPLRPLLPANIRNMTTKFNRTRVAIPAKLGFKSLHGKAPTSCPSNRSATYGRHPANIRCMRANGNRSGIIATILKRTASVARGGVALGQDRDLDGLDGAAVARRAGVGAVARPAEPSELGGVDAVPDGVAGRQVRGQPDPQGLDGAGPAGGAGGAAVADGGLPADVGDVGVFRNI